MKATLTMCRTIAAGLGILFLATLAEALDAQQLTPAGIDGPVFSYQVSRMTGGSATAESYSYTTQAMSGQAQRRMGFTDGRSTDTLWTKAFGGDLKEECYEAIPTSDGGFAMAGYTRSMGAGDSDGWLLKTDDKGTIEWMQTYGDTYVDEFYAIKQLSDGGYILAGLSTAFGWAGDGWLLRTDSLGEVIWSQGYHPEYGAVMSGWDFFYDVIPSDDGGFTAFGYSGYESNMIQAWIMKVDADGTRQWENIFGGEYWDRIFDAQPTPDGGYIAVGDVHHTYDSTITYRHDGWLIKFDAQGDTLWTRHFGTEMHDIFRSVKVLDDGYIICGERQIDDVNPFFGWMMKTDLEGNVIWDQTLSKGGLMAVEIADDGNYVAAGTYLSPAISYEGWLLKLDPSGFIIWESVFNGSILDDMILSLHKTTEGGYIAGGKTRCDVDHGDFWLVNLAVEQPDPLTWFFEDFDGATTPLLPDGWSYSIDVMLQNTAAEVKTIEQGGAPTAPNTVFVMNGINGSNGQLDPTAFVGLVSPYVMIGQGGATISFYGNGGNAIQVGTMSDPSDPATFVLVEEVALITAFEEHTVSLNTPGNTYLVLKHSNTSAVTPVFIDNVLFEQNQTTGMDENEAAAIKVWPNPASRMVHADFGEGIRAFRLFNSTGSMVMSGDSGSSTHQLTLDLSDLPCGCYHFVAETLSGEISSTRIIVMH